LLTVGEPAAGRLLSIHNLTWMLDLFERIRESIEAQTLSMLRRDVAETWDPGPLR
jgi:queuine/archaeosine tRNA-ribosyltransferase